MCKLRQRGQGYGGRPAESRGIDPSLQPLPFAAITGAVLYGRAASRRPGHPSKLNPNCGPVCPAGDIGVALIAGLLCICGWPISASTGRRVLALTPFEVGPPAEFELRAAPADHFQLPLLQRAMTRASPTFQQGRSFGSSIQ